MSYRNPEDQRRAAREHYEANKELYKARAVAHRKKQRAEIKELLRSAKNKPCADCSIQYPYYVMQFDHLAEKAFDLGNARKSMAISRVVEEIAKCEVVCGNCHAERTHQRGQAYSVRVTPKSSVDSLVELVLF